MICRVNIIIQRKIYNYEKTFEPKLDTVLQGLSFQKKMLRPRRTDKHHEFLVRKTGPNIHVE